MFSAACNRITQSCGCAEWDELEGGRWVRKYWACWRHESAATGA